MRVWPSIHLLYLLLLLQTSPPYSAVAVWTRCEHLSVGNIRHTCMFQGSTTSFQLFIP